MDKKWLQYSYNFENQDSLIKKRLLLFHEFIKPPLKALKMSLIKDA